MPFDALAMAAAADDLRQAVVDGRIQKIIQPSALSVALSVYHQGSEHWLLLSADPQQARVHLASERLAKAFAAPSSFIMLLRKHLEGARLRTVDQAPTERVIELRFQAGPHEPALIVEVMGKHSNVILIDGAGRILGPMKTVSPAKSRVRPVMAGREYVAPPPQSRDAEFYGEGRRLDPRTDLEEIERSIGSVAGSATPRQALLGLLAGASPFLVDQIALHAGIASSEPVGTEAVGRLVSAAADLYGFYDTRAWEPCTFVSSSGRRDFAPYRPAGVLEVDRTATLSEAVEAVAGSRENRDVLLSRRAALLKEVEWERAGAARRLASLRQGLEASDRMEAALTEGQLLLAYQHLVEQGADRVAIPDLEMTIRLDPRLTPPENAERLFRRYRKLRDARRKLPPMVEAAERDVQRFDDLAGFVRLAESEADLRDLQRELRGDPTPAKRKQKVTRRGPARYALNGFTAVAGRNARENEEVTFRLGRPRDLWLHARERTGSHVLLRTENGVPPEDVVEAAAGLAAYLSEGRSDTGVDVDVTEVRNVRKIPGGPPGRVTYRGSRTVRVAPGIGSWRKV